MRRIAELMFTLLLMSSAYGQQLLLMQRTWAQNQTTESSDCLQVESDGAYHFEHTMMDLWQPGRREIHAGKLSDDEMKQLREILDNPSLQSLATPTLGNGFMAPDFDFLWVTINRGNDAQHLVFESAAGPHKSSAGSRIPSLSQTPAMSPLMNWYKQISKRKNDIDKKATPTCSLNIRRQ